jgi:hypothetical protein
MTIGERLLNLTAECNRAVEHKAYMLAETGDDVGVLMCRKPSAIVADSETALRELLSPVEP